MPLVILIIGVLWLCLEYSDKIGAAISSIGGCCGWGLLGIVGMIMIAISINAIKSASKGKSK